MGRKLIYKREFANHTLFLLDSLPGKSEFAFG